MKLNRRKFLLASLASQAFAAQKQVQEEYHDSGWGHGMAAFVAMTTWPGEFTDEYFGRPAPDPAAFGMPADDDGSRHDPLLSGVSNPISGYLPDVARLSAAPTRIVIGVGEESAGLMTGRTSVATAEALGQEATVFPSHHGGFVGGEYGWSGQPEAFAARLHEVLDAG